VKLVFRIGVVLCLVAFGAGLVGLIVVAVTEVFL
jgi:hypothetical protein